MIELEGPYRDYTARGRAKRRNTIIGYVLAIIVAIIIFGYMASEVYRGVKAAPRASLSWVTQTQVNRLMRYHGVLAAKVTETEVLIKRDGEWIVVMRRRGG